MPEYTKENNDYFKTNKVLIDIEKEKEKIIEMIERIDEEISSLNEQKVQCVAIKDKLESLEQE